MAAGKSKTLIVLFVALVALAGIAVYMFVLSPTRAPELDEQSESALRRTARQTPADAGLAAYLEANNASELTEDEVAELVRAYQRQVEATTETSGDARAPIVDD